MNESEIRNYFVNDKKVNPIIRMLAGLLSLLCIVMLTEGVHGIIHGSMALDSILEHVIMLALGAVSFWPLSYAAIKGKVPNAWHPY